MGVPVLKMTVAERSTSAAVILSTGTPTPAQWTCRRQCRDRANSGMVWELGHDVLHGLAGDATKDLFDKVLSAFVPVIVWF